MFWEEEKTWKTAVLRDHIISCFIQSYLHGKLHELPTYAASSLFPWLEFPVAAVKKKNQEFSVLTAPIFKSNYRNINLRMGGRIIRDLFEYVLLFQSYLEEII